MLELDISVERSTQSLKQLLRGKVEAMHFITKRYFVSTWIHERGATAFGENIIQNEANGDRRTIPDINKSVYFEKWRSQI